MASHARETAVWHQFHIALPAWHDGRRACAQGPGRFDPVVVPGFSR